jgi:uncharacterized protein (DUF779 family)
MMTMDRSTVAPGVIATEGALAAIADLVQDRGPVMFFQSGGCCDGSLPICFADGEFVVGDHDVLLGHVGGCPFYIDHRQYEVWKHTQLILDVSEGDPEGFSLPADENKHFVIRSRVFGADELPTRKPRATREASIQDSTSSQRR